MFVLLVNRDQWFYGDEWEFLVDRSLMGGSRGLFEPHNEHWSTTPILLYALAFRLVGVTTYAPYVALLVVAHLAVVHVLWRLMLRGGAHPWIATAAAAAFIPFGPGADNLLWAFQMGFVGSVALGLLHTDLVTRPGPFGPRDVTGWGISAVALSCSGVGVPMAAVAALAAAFRRGWRAFFYTAAVPAGVYLLWFFTAGSPGVLGHPPLTDDAIRMLPEFVGRGLGAALAWGTGWTAVGMAGLAAAAVALSVRVRERRPVPHAALACLVGAGMLLAMVGIGRTALGLDVAEATRYVYVVGGLLLPITVIGLSDLAARHTVGTVLLVAVLAAWGLHNARLLRDAAERQAERERLIREQFRAALQLHDRGAVLLGDTPDPIRSPNVQLHELLRVREMLPDVTPSAEARLGAALALQVAVEDVPRFRTGDISSARAYHASVSPLSGGCREAVPAGPVPRLLVPSHGGASWEIRAAPRARVELVVAADGTKSPDPLPMPLPAPAYLNASLEQGTVVLRFSERLALCAVPPDG